MISIPTFNPNTLTDIQTSAHNCLAVSQYEYKFSAGKKIGDTKFLITGINTDDFTHIVGLEHIPSIKRAVQNSHKRKAQMFSKIISGLSAGFFKKDDFNAFVSPIKDTYNSQTQSQYTIADRISKTKDLMATLDRSFNGVIYRWDPQKCNIRLPDGKIRQCTIKADYLLEGNANLIPSYLFLGARKEDEKEQMCRTFFRIEDKDYTEGQPKYTLLKKEKVHLPTGNMVTQFDKLSVKED